MSNSFNDQLSRMKALMTYGAVNEDAKPISTHNIEYKAKAADGKYYGIIRENSKYFVKVATPGKETIAEAYQYIGGINNKANYEYNSYSNALKQFELKLGSINEAYDEDRKVNVEALDPYRKEDLVIEGTEKMKNELARQRQIMRNACVIMNEATEIGIGKTPYEHQPEAPKADSGDKDYPFTKEGKPEADRGAIKFDGGDPKKHSSTFGEDSNDVEDYDLDKGKAPKVAGSVASESPKGGKVARVNESMEECGKGCMLPEEGDEDLELGQEEEPVDTDELNPVKPEELGDDEAAGEDSVEDGDLEGEDLDDDEFGFDDDDDDLGDEDELDDDDDLDDDEDFGDEEEFDDEENLDDDEDFGDDEEFGDDEDFGDDEEFDDEENLDDEEEDPEIELDENIVRKFRKLVRESINELGLGGQYPDIDDEEDDEEELPGDDVLISENLIKKIPMLVRESINEFGNENLIDTDSSNIGPLKTAQPLGSEQDEPEEDEFDDEDDEFNPDQADDYNNFHKGESALASLEEAKAAKMNSIVESVVKDILKEDELHVFGDHPGYRKKPMTLPQTGEDKFQVNRDWNDDSVHSEEPFGKGKGDSTPFDQLVAQITDSVMKQINEGKKKVK